MILDRLSERSSTHRKYIGQIYQSTRAEAIVITARAHQTVQGATPVVVYPQPLNGKSLLRFMDNLAKELALDQQIELAPKLAKLYRDSSGGAGDDTPILPLPVRLFVDEAIRLIRSGQSLNALPSQLPQVYSRYLEAVNPQDPSASNFMTHSEMLRAATSWRRSLLTEIISPRSFSELLPPKRSAPLDGPTRKSSITSNGSYATEF